jgi:hypothetical protein
MATRPRPTLNFPKPAPAGGAKPDRPPSRAGRKAITFYVEPSVWEQTRVLSIRQGRTTQAILEELLARYLTEHGAKAGA